MGMFLIEKDVKCRVIKEGKEWYTENIIRHITKKPNVFMKHEMVIENCQENPVRLRRG